MFSLFYKRCDNHWQCKATSSSLWQCRYTCLFFNYQTNFVFLLPNQLSTIFASCLLILDPVCWPRLGDPFESHTPLYFHARLYIYHSGVCDRNVITFTTIIFLMQTRLFLYFLGQFARFSDYAVQCFIFISTHPTVVAFQCSWIFVLSRYFSWRLHICFSSHFSFLIIVFFEFLFILIFDVVQFSIVERKLSFFHYLYSSNTSNVHSRVRIYASFSFFSFCGPGFWVLQFKNTVLYNWNNPRTSL